MNSELLLHFSEAVDALFRRYAGNLSTASENANTFTLPVKVVSPREDLSGLGEFHSFLDLLSITIRGSLQQVNYNYAIRPGGLIECTDWSEDNDVTPQPLNEAVNKLFMELARNYSPKGCTAPIGRFGEILSALQDGGVSFSTSIDIQVNKETVVANLGLPPKTSCLIFFLANKLESSLGGHYFWDIASYWGSGSADKQVILLANAAGRSQSPWLDVLGKDEWVNAASAFQVEDRFSKNIADAVAFRKDEVSWDIKSTSFTPYAFHFENSTLDKPNLVKIINNLCVQACLCYLANRAYLENGVLVGEFAAQNKIKVFLSPTPSELAEATNLYTLFNWSYENAKSDKLNLTRQVITASLPDDPKNDLKLLLAKSADILLGAKNNYRFYLRKSVEQYFIKRQSVIEFLEKFADDTNEAISKMASDLVSDLYKTIGVIIADAIAILIDPRYTLAVIHWTAIFYLVYIAIILLIQLSFGYLKFVNSARSLSINLGELSMILTTEELDEIRKKQYTLPRLLFLGSFTFTTLIYAIIGTITFILFNLTG